MPGTVEVQKVAIAATSDSIRGTFCLAYAGFASTEIPYDATASRVEAALESIATVGDVSVTRELTQSASGYGISWAVTFVNNVGNLEPMSISCNHLVGTSVDIVTTTTEGADALFTSGSVGILEYPLSSTVVKTESVQTITSMPPVLTLMAVSTSAITESCPSRSMYTTAEDMEYYLEGMATITDVTVTVTELTLQATEKVQNYGRIWTVTFHDSNAASLFVSNGNEYGTTVAGGTLLGTNTMVSVEKVATETLNNYVEISGLDSSASYVARVKASNGAF